MNGGGVRYLARHPRQQMADVRPIEAEAKHHPLAGARAAHQALALQCLQVSGGAGLRESDVRGEIAHAALGGEQRVSDPKTGRNPEASQNRASFEGRFIHCTGMHTTCFR
jgi:hypothetical protein